MRGAHFHLSGKSLALVYAIGSIDLLYSRPLPLGLSKPPVKTPLALPESLLLDHIAVVESELAANQVIDFWLG